MGALFGPAQPREISETERDALRSGCPDCHQPAGEWCVYMPIAMVDPHSQRPSVQEKLLRVGTPTKRLHNGRTVQARYELWHRENQRQQQRRRALLATTRPRTELLAAERACRQADYRDYLTLALWLRQYGSIFNIATPTEGEDHDQD